MVKLLRRAAVLERTGLPRSSLYDEMARGTFPRPVNISDRAVGWIEDEIDSWLAARIAERDAAPKVRTEQVRGSKPSGRALRRGRPPKRKLHADTGEAA